MCVRVRVGVCVCVVYRELVYTTIYCATHSTCTTSDSVECDCLCVYKVQYKSFVWKIFLNTFPEMNYTHTERRRS